MVLQSQLFTGYSSVPTILLQFLVYCLFVSLFVHQLECFTVCLNICLLVYLPVCLSVFLSACQSGSHETVSQFDSLRVSQYKRLCFVCFLFVCLFICLLFYPLLQKRKISLQKEGSVEKGPKCSLAFENQTAPIKLTFDTQVGNIAQNLFLDLRVSFLILQTEPNKHHRT